MKVVSETLEERWAEAPVTSWWCSDPWRLSDKLIKGGSGAMGGEGRGRWQEPSAVPQAEPAVLSNVNAGRTPR